MRILELLVALSITLGLGTVLFQLFHQNERVMRDQTLITEMQQTARIVSSQIADEIRIAGQGVPLSAARFDPAPSEAGAVFLPSSSSARIDFRAGFSNVESSITNALPLDFTAGESRVVSVVDTSQFPAGRFVYMWTSSAWLRAEVTNSAPNSLTLMPRQTGAVDMSAHFAAPPAVSLEEAVSIYLSGKSVRIATATEFANPSVPSWSAANEIGRNFKSLDFAYYDARGNAVQPASLERLAARLSIARVDLNLTVEAAAPLSDGTRPTYSIALRTVPRNVRIAN